MGYLGPSITHPPQPAPDPARHGERRGTRATSEMSVIGPETTVGRISTRPFGGLKRPPSQRVVALSLVVTARDNLSTSSHKIEFAIFIDSLLALTRVGISNNTLILGAETGIRPSKQAHRLF